MPKAYPFHREKLFQPSYVQALQQEYHMQGRTARQSMAARHEAQSA